MSLYELLWFFFIYAFIGWCTEVSFSMFIGRGFVNRGYFYGPMCSIYGYTMLIIITLMSPVKDNILLLYIGSAAIASLSELSVGWFSYTILGYRLWDYSDQPLHLDGHICFSFCLIWGVLGSAVVLFLHPFLLGIIRGLPYNLGLPLLIIITAIFMVDIFLTKVTHRRVPDTISHTS